MKGEIRTDGVNTAARASVTARGAAGSGRGLRGSVGDGVTSGGATALEGVVKANPVTDFVSGSLCRKGRVC